MAHLRVEQNGPAGCTVWAERALVAEVRDLRLTALVLRPGTASVLDEHVPLPLYWQQYADHQHPERNASSGGRLTITAATGDAVSVVCEGSSASGALASRFSVSLALSPDGAIRAMVSAECAVRKGTPWSVTPNPQHGELEFCNFWPAESFVLQPDVTRYYPEIHVRQKEWITRIAHHHLETSDKRNIILEPGDALGWIREKRAIMLELHSGARVHAGICAYMWDVHLGIKICREGTAIQLPGGFQEAASFSIREMTGVEAGRWQEQSSTISMPEIALTPLVVEGTNRFRETLALYPGKEHLQWPWTFEPSPDQGGAVRGCLDTTVGYDDNRSLQIAGSPEREGRWIATTLGPAFGGRPFRPGTAYRLSAQVRTRDLSGGLYLAIRLHRTGAGDLFDAAHYEVFASPESTERDSDWHLLQIETPRISPEPDRLHLVLVHRGSGTSWFDNVLLEEIG